MRDINTDHSIVDCQSHEKYVRFFFTGQLAKYIIVTRFDIAGYVKLCVHIIHKAIKGTIKQWSSCLLKIPH